jgi:hypothetical protein
MSNGRGEGYRGQVIQGSSDRARKHAVHLSEPRGMGGRDRRNEDRGQRTKDRGLRTGDQGLRAGDDGPRDGSRGLLAEVETEPPFQLVPNGDGPPATACVLHFIRAGEREGKTLGYTPRPPCGSRVRHAHSKTQVNRCRLPSRPAWPGPPRPCGLGPNSTSLDAPGSDIIGVDSPHATVFLQGSAFIANMVAAGPGASK